MENSKQQLKKEKREAAYRRLLLRPFNLSNGGVSLDAHAFDARGEVGDAIPDLGDLRGQFRLLPILDKSHKRTLSVDPSSSSKCVHA